MPMYRVNDAELSVFESGEGDPLLLVHGFPLDHTMWERQFEALSDQGKLIAPDLRGFGSSSVTSGTVTMAQFADDLAALLDAMEIVQPVVFCGLSMGGYIGWEFWKRHPSRLRRFILCDTRAVADDAPAAKVRHKTADKVLADGTEFLAETMSEKLFGLKTREKNPEIIEATRQVIRGTAPEAVAAALRGMAERADFHSQLPEMDLPTLVLCGTEDPLSPPREMEAFAEEMPDAEFVEVPDAGHMAPLENPEFVNHAIRVFLAT